MDIMAWMDINSLKDITVFGKCNSIYKVASGSVEGYASL
jgi:hypothetical protein